MTDRRTADLLFEAKFLKEIPRSGFGFLGNGSESVAEHTYMTTFIAFILSRMTPDADAGRLIEMCLVHDLPEARIGDLNTVQKSYVVADETRAVEDMARASRHGEEIAGLIAEFNAGRSLEALLARDADQLALVMELKDLIDKGYAPAEKWLPHVQQRIRTDPGNDLLGSILGAERDHWWLKNYIDSP
jgi:putative hydrolases of HD superfamily